MRACARRDVARAPHRACATSYHRPRPQAQRVARGHASLGRAPSRGGQARQGTLGLRTACAASRCRRTSAGRSCPPACRRTGSCPRCLPLFFLTRVGELLYKAAAAPLVARRTTQRPTVPSAGAKTEQPRQAPIRPTASQSEPSSTLLCSCPCSPSHPRPQEEPHLAGQAVAAATAAGHRCARPSDDSSPQLSPKLEP
jgi:hypothetical protein